MQLVFELAVRKVPRLMPGSMDLDPGLQPVSHNLDNASNSGSSIKGTSDHGRVTKERHESRKVARLLF